MTLEYTGERMVPEEADRHTFWEHIYRYRFASHFVTGKRVLDIACGEGYGSAAMIRAGASTVIGVDVSPIACAHAAQRYGLETRVGDAQAIPLDTGSVDLVVSFETIEHVPKPEKFLDECLRVLAPGGRVIISTPNRDAYARDALQNPYHLNEMNEDEFVTVLGARFGGVEMHTQRPMAAALGSLRVLASERLWETRGLGRLRRFLQRNSCLEIADAPSLEKARQDPIRAILASESRCSHLFNPFSIRDFDPASGELPLYLIAVASLHPNHAGR